MISDDAFFAYAERCTREDVMSRHAFALCWSAPARSRQVDRQEVLRMRATNPPERGGLGLAAERFDAAAAALRAAYEAAPAAFMDDALSGGLWQSATTLLAKQLPPVRWTVEGLLAQGLAILASPPKYGKSWMALDLCIQTAAGGRFLGCRCPKAECLYLALEATEARL